jgi:hypothetical protein
MGTRWLIVITITVVAVGALAGRYYQNTGTNALAQPKEIVHTIKYDVVGQKVTKVIDENGNESTTQWPIIRGIPGPLQGKIINLSDPIHILSDISSPGCTCYDNICVGSTC